MSLLDGLMLEPLSPRRVLGVFSLTGLTVVSNVATATTNSAHGLQNGDSVEIQGVTGDGAQWWNGVFVVHGIEAGTPAIFKYRMVGAPLGAVDYSNAKVNILGSQEVYISDRGVSETAGSGTIADPYNGTAFEATGRYAANSISELTASGRIATAVCPNHDFVAGERVTVVGVKVVGEVRSDARMADFKYMGTFLVKGVGGGGSSAWFSYVMLSSVYSSPAVPEDVSVGIRCWRERERFDILARKIPGNSLIRLGAGLFHSKGTLTGSFSGGFDVKRGQRWIGAGMAATTVQLVHAVAVPHDTTICALEYDNNPDLMGSVEICDLCVDANVDRQASIHSNCGCVVARNGKLHRVHNVLCKNFASRGPVYYNENWVIYVTGSAPANEMACNLVEGCVTEAPSPNNRHGSTVIMQAGGAGYAMRHNCVDEQVRYGAVRTVLTIEQVGATAAYKITTHAKHGLKVPGNVSVAGVLVSPSTGVTTLNNRFNGVFKIDSVTDYEVVFTPYALGLGEVNGSPVVGPATRIGMPVPQHALRLVGGNSTSTQPSTESRLAAKSQDLSTAGSGALFGFKRPHNCTENNFLRFVNIRVWNATQSLQPGNIDNHANGYYKVRSAVSKIELDYETPKMTAITFPVSIGEGNSGHPALSLGGNNMTSADIGHCAVEECNNLLHGATGGSWHDTNSTGSIVMRNNVYIDNQRGPSQNLGLINARHFCAISRDPGDYSRAIVSVSGSLPNLTKGQVVYVEGKMAGNFAPLTGFFTVENLISSSSFSYRLLSAAPEPSADSSNPVPSFFVHAEVGLLIFENNYLEEALSVSEGYWGQPGIASIKVGSQDPDPANTPAVVFRNVVVRENVTRQSNGKSNSVWNGAFSFSHAENLLVQNNIVDVGQANQNSFTSKTAFPSYFNNQKSSGKLIPAVEKIFGTTNIAPPLLEISDQTDAGIMLLL